MFKTTKIAAAAIATTLALGTAASADSYFIPMMEVDDNTNFTLQGVTSDVDGQVVFFDYTGGERGDVLATIPVNTGANVDIPVTLDRVPSGDVLAVLFEGDMMEGRGLANFVIEIE